MIPAVVLAAGTSTRMGRQKLLLPMAGGVPLVRLSVERIVTAGVDEVLVVLGRDADAVAAALAGLPVRAVLNPRYAEGQSTSLRAGLDALPDGADAVLLALGDQPLPDPGVIARLVALFRATGCAIAVPRYRNGRGHPVLFAAALFDELRRVTGDQGGRAVIARDPDRVTELSVDAPMPPDVDTWEDYQAIR